MGVLHNGSAWGALNLMNFPSPSSNLGIPYILKTKHTEVTNEAIRSTERSGAATQTIRANSKAKHAPCNER
jgi:hypothetical protein